MHIAKMVHPDVIGLLLVKELQGITQNTDLTELLQLASENLPAQSPNLKTEPLDFFLGFNQQLPGPPLLLVRGHLCDLSADCCEQFVSCHLSVFPRVG